MVTMNTESPLPFERKKVEKSYRMDRLHDQEKASEGIFEVYAIVWFERSDGMVWLSDIPFKEVRKAYHSEEKYLRVYANSFDPGLQAGFRRSYKSGDIFDAIADLQDHVTLSLHRGLEYISEDTLWADWEALMHKADKGSELAREFAKYNWLRNELYQSRAEAAQACGFTGPDFRKWRK